MLTVKPVAVSTTNVSICTNQLPYSWNAKICQAAGTYSDTLVSASGCDSVATLILDVNAVLTSTVTATVCANQLPYNLNGKTYNEAGTYEDTLRSTAGCDSIATFILQVNRLLTSTTTATICANQLPYSLNGRTYTTAGVYADTLKTGSGCDSLATLVLVINPVPETVVHASICANQLPYMHNGKMYTEAGTYSDTLISVAGCDSVATLVLSVTPVVTSTTTATVCPGQLPYSWNGKTYYEAGTYHDTLTSAAGCDSVAALILTVNDVTTSTANVTVCAGQLPYTWKDKTYTQEGVYNDTLSSAAGCDSVATLVLHVRPLATSATTAVICVSQLPYTWNAKSYTAAGTYTDTLVSASACDSIATLILKVSPVLTSTASIAVCSRQLPYNLNGHSFTGSGVYTDTLKSVTGCDSIATLILTVSPVVTSTASVAICNNQLPYTWNGKAFTETGTYTDTLTSTSGCDSVAILSLTVSSVLNSTFNVNICTSQLPYNWNGRSFTAAGVYSDTLKGSTGCDSIATLVLNVNAAVSDSSDVAICSSQLPYSWNGRILIAAGIYNDTLTSASGCDSVITLVLTVKPVATGKTNVSICSNQLPYNWNGRALTAAGTYNDTLASASGCDSVATLVLQVNNVLASTVAATVCASQLPYGWNGKVYTAAGTYSDTLTSTAGCDSVATLVLMVSDVVTSATSVAVCASQLPYSWNGRSFAQAGSYQDTLRSVSGCDSISTLVLTVNPVAASTASVSICASQLSYSWNGKNYSYAGTYSDTLTSAAGCDSIATLILRVNAAVTSSRSVAICPDQLPYSWNGKTFTTAGTYSDTLTSSSGCDSVATLVLQVNPVLTGTITAAVCSNQLPYSWNGKTYYKAGVYKDTFRSASGCDSVATLVLTVNPATTSTTNVAICANMLPYSWNGSNYQSAGTYTYTLKSNAGCDSIATLNLTVGAVVTSTANIAVCASQLPYKWNNKNYTAAGIYSDTLRNAAGCDSVATLVLVISPALSGSASITICANQLPYKWNGKAFREAGTYKATLRSTAGCDSVATLVLSVNPLQISTVNQTICPGQQSFRWNRRVYTEAGTYTDTLQSASGCDSVVILNLKVGEPDTETRNITICASSYTLPDGKVVSTGGTYRTILSSTTCDKIIVTNLTMQAAPKLKVTNPVPACVQTVIDLTAAPVTAGSEAGLTYKYWMDSTAATPLPSPQRVAVSGVYYISGTTAAGCTAIKPVTAIISAPPVFVVTNPATICGPATVDLTAAAITSGSSAGLAFTYWNDAAASRPVDNPKAVAASGTYYIRAGAAGCAVTQSAQVKVTISKAAQPIRYATVMAGTNTPVEIQARYLGNDMAYRWNPATGLNTNSGRTPVFNYNKDMEYTVTATSPAGCATVDTVAVRMQVTNTTPNGLKSDILVPKAWTPNKDGHNDQLVPLPVRIRQLRYFRIFNRWGQLVFETTELGKGWDGVFNGKPQVADVYTWTLDAIGEDDHHFTLMGNSILIR